MKVTNITEAKAQLSRLVDEVQRGETVVIGRAGRPLAVLTAFTRDTSPRKFGGWKGRVWMADDFDDLPEDLLAAFEGDDVTPAADE